MANLTVFFAGFKKGITDFSHNISTIINFILLSIVYFIGVFISFLLLKVAGKHQLRLRQSKNIVSYWNTLDLKKKNLDEYYRQF